jgi:hypothetical protein
MRSFYFCNYIPNAPRSVCETACCYVLAYFEKEIYITMDRHLTFMMLLIHVEYELQIKLINYYLNWGRCFVGYSVQDEVSMAGSENSRRTKWIILKFKADCAAL